MNRGCTDGFAEPGKSRDPDSTPKPKIFLRTGLKSQPWLRVSNRFGSRPPPPMVPVMWPKPTASTGVFRLADQKCGVLALRLNASARSLQADSLLFKREPLEHCGIEVEVARSGET